VAGRSGLHCRAPQGSCGAGQRHRQSAPIPAAGPAEAGERCPGLQASHPRPSLHAAPLPILTPPCHTSCWARQQRPACAAASPAAEHFAGELVTTAARSPLRQTVRPCARSCRPCCGTRAGTHAWRPATAWAASPSTPRTRRRRTWRAPPLPRRALQSLVMTLGQRRSCGPRRPRQLWGQRRRP